MKKRINNIIIYTFVFIIIASSLVIPNILFEIQDQDIQMEVYKNYDAEENTSIVSVEAQDIYLVKAIHDIESENIVVQISSSEISEKIVTTMAIDDNIVSNDNNKIGKIKQEFEKLKQSNIIKDFESFTNSEIFISIVNKVYQKENTKYTISNISLDMDYNNAQIEIEEKTGKIIKLIMKKENISNEFLNNENVNYDNLNSEFSKEEILKRYIEYLDLYIIDDWRYEDNVMKSQKTDLEVSLVQSVNSGICILSIHSNYKMSSNIVEYEISGN